MFGSAHNSAMRAKFCLAVFAAFLPAVVTLAQTPPSADEVLAKARAKAAEDHKSIFLAFDASW